MKARIQTRAIIIMTALLVALRAVGAEPELRTSAATNGVWVAGIGSGFREDAFHAGAAVGGGFGANRMGSKRTHDLALVTGHFGWIFSDVVAPDTWLRGNWEVVGEVFAGAQFSPDDRYLFGLTPLLRYNFATGSRWVPFLDGGAGVTYTDIGRPDLSTHIQFNDQGGIGTHYFVRENVAVTLQYRFMHISNAGIKEPNHGVNVNLFKAGVSWFF